MNVFFSSCNIVNESFSSPYISLLPVVAFLTSSVVCLVTKIKKWICLSARIIKTYATQTYVIFLLKIAFNVKLSHYRVSLNLMLYNLKYMYNKSRIEIEIRKMVSQDEALNKWLIRYVISHLSRHFI